MTCELLSGCSSTLAYAGNESRPTPYYSCQPSSGIVPKLSWSRASVIDEINSGANAASWFCTCVNRPGISCTCGRAGALAICLQAGDARLRIYTSDGAMYSMCDAGLPT